jgi:hypothetical protein
LTRKFEKEFLKDFAISSRIFTFGPSSQQSYSGSTALAAGQTINIAVGYDASRENGGSDNTNLQGTITLVPEPSTWVMLVGAAGSLVGFLRRRRR